MTIATHQWTLFTTAKARRFFFNTRRVGRTRTEQNIIVRIGRSKGELTNDKRWHSTYLLLNLTTDRHEASHGLPATAELLVISMKRKFTAKLAIYSVVIIHHKLYLCFIKFSERPVVSFKIFPSAAVSIIFFEFLCFVVFFYRTNSEQLQKTCMFVCAVILLWICCFNVLYILYIYSTYSVPSLTKQCELFFVDYWHMQLLTFFHVLYTFSYHEQGR